MNVRKKKGVPAKFKRALLDKITRFYLDSPDFNGISYRQLAITLPGPNVSAALRALVSEGLVEALWVGPDLNPHIRRLVIPPRAAQVERLSEPDPSQTCLYPSPDHLHKVVDRSQYSREPYKFMLALGSSQLSYKSFDLSILEYYRNDPRYTYQCDDMHGSISISDEYFRASKIPESDQILLETFGFSYNNQHDRAVTTFVCYLARLSPAHQQVWKAKELGDEFKIHPDFFRTQIVGDWPEQLPIFTAILMEMETINHMAEAMKRPHFFRQVPSDENRPKKFGFLVRPTLAEFNDFIHLLDKLLSDNLNKDFFQGEVTDEQEEQRADGKVIIRPKGTLQMLDQWVRSEFRTDDWMPLDSAMATLRKIRNLRQKPAHAIQEDVFDQVYFHQQRKIVIDTYMAVKILRLMLANHPSTHGIKIHQFLIEGKICAY